MGASADAVVMQRIAPVGKQAEKRRHTDVACRFPQRDAEPGALKLRQYLAAGRVVDAVGVKPGVGAAIRAGVPQGGRITLDQLADSMAKRLAHAVARAQPVAAAFKAAAAGWRGQGVIRPHHLERYPATAARNQLIPLDP